MKICPFCSESIQDSAVKCRFCGEFLEKKPDKKKNNNEKSSKLENAKNNTQNILKKAPEYLAYLGGFSFVYFFGIVPAAIILVPSFLGVFLGNHLSKNKNKNILSRIFTIVSLISWFIPPIGCFTSSTGFSLQNGMKNKSYWINVFAFVLSIINSIIGMLMQIGYL